MTAVAEGTRDGGISWASVNAIFPNVKVVIEAAVTAVVINHGNGELNRMRVKGGGIQYQ